MNPQRSSPAQAGKNRLLWAGLAFVVIIVLVMGASLIWIQARPQEPRSVVLPTSESPPANTTPALASASTGAASSSAPLPPASVANGPRVDIPRPRIVHPHASEPAVARAPERVAPRPDAIEGETPPDVKR